MLTTLPTGLSFTTILLALCGVFKGTEPFSFEPDPGFEKTRERGKIRKGCRRLLEKRGARWGANP